MTRSKVPILGGMLWQSKALKEKRGSSPPMARLASRSIPSEISERVMCMFPGSFDKFWVQRAPSTASKLQNIHPSWTGTAGRSRETSLPGLQNKDCAGWSWKKCWKHSGTDFSDFFPWQSDGSGPAYGSSPRYALRKAWAVSFSVFSTSWSCSTGSVQASAVHSGHWSIKWLSGSSIVISRISSRENPRYFSSRICCSLAKSVSV